MGRPSRSSHSSACHSKSDEEFRNELRAALPEERRSEFERLAPRLFYHCCDVGDPDSLAALSDRLGALPGGRESGRLFYLSLEPERFAVATTALARAELLETREGKRDAWRRVVIEKPSSRTAWPTDTTRAGPTPAWANGRAAPTSTASGSPRR